MSFELWLSYVTTVVLLMSTPGPSHLLMLSNSLSCGFPRSMSTAVGDLSANFLQMLAAALGLATLIQSSRSAFLIIKWCGVTYLVFLGIRLWTRTTDVTLERPIRRSVTSLYLEGFVTSAANPKAVIFFAALFPLFIDLSRPMLSQFTILSATYLLIDLTFLTFYGKAAAGLRKYTRSKGYRIVQRLSALLLVIAAIVLGTKSLELQNTNGVFKKH